jgi:hypothetical protein
MKVHELIKKLSALPQDAECYYASFQGFLTDDLQSSKAITNKRDCEVYNIECELETVYQWVVREQRFVPYTGVIFEVD